MLSCLISFWELGAVEEKRPLSTRLRYKKYLYSEYKNIHVINHFHTYLRFVYYVKPRITELHRQRDKNIKGRIGEADRRVPRQPNVFIGTDGKVAR